MEGNRDGKRPKQKEKHDSKNDKKSRKMSVKQRKKKKAGKNVVDLGLATGSEASKLFDLNEITDNKEASALMNDLVKCFTSNSTLPQEELELLNQTLYNKTVSVFLSTLNKCVDKIFDKIMNMDYFKELATKNKVIQKSVSCQTDISYEMS